MAAAQLSLVMTEPIMAVTHKLSATTGYPVESGPDMQQSL